jgi:tartrate dehydratase alpha subunit/fumarate hydratase class I-like protein
VKGIDFSIKIQPNIEAATDAAVKICQDNGDKIGVSKEDVPGCVNSIVAYIRETFTKAYEEAVRKQQANASAAASGTPEVVAPSETEVPPVTN